MTYYAGLDVSLKEFSVVSAMPTAQSPRGTVECEPGPVGEFFEERSSRPDRVVHEIQLQFGGGVTSRAGTWDGISSDLSAARLKPRHSFGAAVHHELVRHVFQLLRHVLTDGISSMSLRECDPGWGGAWISPSACPAAASSWHSSQPRRSRWSPMPASAVRSVPRSSPSARPSGSQPDARAFRSASPGP